MDTLTFSDRELLACESYHLPSHVTHHVDLVTSPTVHFQRHHFSVSGGGGGWGRGRGGGGGGGGGQFWTARDSTSVPADKIGVPGLGFQGPKTTGEISEILKDLKDCDKQITPACLRVLYGVVGVPVAAEKNSYAIGT